ncbi:hypothetical protein D3C80_2228770 [compost metagenome]
MHVGQQFLLSRSKNRFALRPLGLQEQTGFDLVRQDFGALDRQAIGNRPTIFIVEIGADHIE